MKKGRKILIIINDLKIINNSNFLVIRRPISTINIDDIIFNFIEIKGENQKMIISPGEDGIFL